MIIIENKDKIPVQKGCKNEQCFCTGKCKEIVGYIINGKFEPISKITNQSDFVKYYKNEKNDR